MNRQGEPDMAAPSWLDDRSLAGRAIRRACNLHRQGPAPSVAIMSTPRSGSTWLMELIRTQPGFKSVEEPLNLRTPAVVRHLGVDDWSEMYGPAAAATLEGYFRGFLDGRLRFMDHRPLAPHHRWVTNRIVFKILHGAEDQTSMLRGLGLDLVHLLRHPLPVALSRRELPRLPALLSDANLSRFPGDVAEFALARCRDGDDLERAVVAWCLQNAPLLASEGITLVTYEQLVVEPETVINHLSHTLALPEPARMLSSVRVPSHSHAPADDRRRSVLQSGGATDAAGLVDTWRNDLAAGEARRLMDTVSAFGIGVYRFDDPMPAHQYLIPSPNRHEATT
jgi:hypothetical protein